MNQRDLEKAISREVENWPGVSVEFVTGGKHPKAKLTFDGKMLNQPYSGSPSDSAAGIHNLLSDVRRQMKKLGASRTTAEPSKDEDEAPYRKANDGKEKRPDPVAGEKAAPQADLSDQLASKGLKGKAARVVIVDDLAGGDVDAIKAAFEARVASITDGIYFDLPDDVYHAVPRLSSSGIQRIDVSPATFWRGSWLDPNKPDPEDEETIWRILGRAYHVARLEPHLFEAVYCRDLDKADAPEGTLFTGVEMGKELEEAGLKKSGSVAEQAERLMDSGFPREKIWHFIKQDWEAARRGRTGLPAKHYDQMIIDRDRISSNAEIAPLLQGGEAEVSVFWTDEYGIQMKARIDYLCRDHWADFKTFDNSRGKNLNQCLSDAMRYNRYYIQASVYREAVENIRLNNLPINGQANDDQRALIAHIQMKPGELACWYVFQEKGGVPNLLAREFKFYMVPYTTIFAEAGVTDEDRRRVVREATQQRTQLFVKGLGRAIEAKKMFTLYSQVYQPGEPWAPIHSLGSFSDDDFHPYWLSGDME